MEVEYHAQRTLYFQTIKPNRHRRPMIYLVRPVAPLLATLGGRSSPVRAVTTLVYARGSVSSGGTRVAVATAARRVGSGVRRSVPGCCCLAAGSTIALCKGNPTSEEKSRASVITNRPKQRSKFETDVRRSREW